MACIYIPTKVLGGFKIALITLIFILVTVFLTLFFLRGIIVENWDKYKCNPLIMPFAEMFGFDSSEVLASCIGYSARKSTDDVKEEVSSNINDMNTFLNDMNGGISLLKDQLASSEAGTQSQFDEYFESLNNTTSTMEYLGLKVQTIFFKIVAVYITLIYASYSMMNGLDAVINDKKLNKAIDTIMNPGKALKVNRSFKRFKKFVKSAKNFTNIG